MADTLWMGGVILNVVMDERGAGRFYRHHTGDGQPDIEDTPDLWAPEPPGRVQSKLLTRAETDVLLWISRGYESNEEIGKFLGRSRATVDKEINNIFIKLRLHSRSQLMGWIKRGNVLTGMVDPSSRN